MSKTTNVRIKNKRAYFEYEILDKYVAGIQLLGSEIKSLREGKANLNDGYCLFLGNELWIKSMYIAEYKLATHTNHESRRIRKLLLKKKELSRLMSKVKERGFTIIPLQLFISDRGIAKLEIALARGKKIYDKRESIKQKDMKRDFDKKTLSAGIT